MRQCSPRDQSSDLVSRRRFLGGAASLSVATLAGCESFAAPRRMDDVLVRNRSGEGTVTVTVTVRRGENLRLSESPVVDDASAAPFDGVWETTGEYTVTASRQGGDEVTDTVSVDSLEDTLWVTAGTDGALTLDLRET
ncbi:MULTISPECIES: hypothetical protein [Salinibaculum]|uniref:hypothetical protein n=1 Tax=Salinibaculum TaxID=2732368 RepID=UPI0030D2E28E